MSLTKNACDRIFSKIYLICFGLSLLGCGPEQSIIVQEPKSAGAFDGAKVDVETRYWAVKLAFTAAPTTSYFCTELKDETEICPG